MEVWWGFAALDERSPTKRGLQPPGRVHRARSRACAENVPRDEGTVTSPRRALGPLPLSGSKNAPRRRGDCNVVRYELDREEEELDEPPRR